MLAAVPTLELRFPSHQNAVELFGDRWLTRIEEVYPGLKSGPDTYLRADTRPVIAANHLGYAPGSFHGMHVLELGPMEGMHTYQIDKLGAESVTSIEANSNAYLRCLVMKEILQYRCKFLLGDALKYLQKCNTNYDLIFCSGILYHMENPYELIKAIAQRTNRVFLWTHYFDPALPKGPDCKPRTVNCDGLEMVFYEHTYNVDLNTQSFWGGNHATAAWLSKDTIDGLFRHFGFQLAIHDDVRTWDIGHHITATALRV
jgi:hypothetical protein